MCITDIENKLKLSGWFGQRQLSGECLRPSISHA